MLAVNERSARISSFNRRATGNAACNAASWSEKFDAPNASVKSKYASSIDIGSITAPARATIAMIARDSSR